MNIWRCSADHGSDHRSGWQGRRLAAVGLAVLGLLFTAMAAEASAPAQHALLVGVSEYPDLHPDLALDGPRKDIPRLRSLLLQQGFDAKQIRVLADGVDGAHGLPTLAAITDAMEQLIDTVKADDLVFLHFAGHGSQSPTDDLEKEPDGLNELFLPRDVSNWNFEQKEIPNALYDYQVGEWLDALRGKGANVWVVFDSCHAGTMTRSVADADVRMRQVTPEALGIPVTRTRGAAASNPAAATPSFMQPGAGGEESDKRATGDLIAFFAAQSHETTPEMRLPLGDPNAEFNGLFTYTFARVLAQNPNISYRQLAQMIMVEYNGLPWRSSTPLVTGTNMDRRVFHRDGDIPTRYTVRRDGSQLIMDAGQLNGFEPDAVVALYTSVTATEPAFRVVVEEASLVSSRAAIPEEFGRASVWAQLERPALSVSHRVRWVGTPPAPWDKAIDALDEHDFLSRTLQWVGPGESADLLLHVADGQLFFIGRDDQISCALLKTLSLPEASGCEAVQADRLRALAIDGEPDARAATVVLHNGLQRWVRATNLLRTASVLRGGRGTLDTRFEFRRGGSGPWQPYDPASSLALYAGDEVRLAVTNRGRSDADISVLFVDNAHGIYQLWPEPGQAGRLGPGQTAQALAPTEVTSDTVGAEQLLVLHNPVSRGGPPVSYAWLEQSGMEYSALRAAGTDPLGSGVAVRGSLGLLAEAIGDMPLTRGLGTAARTGAAEAGAEVIRWETRTP
ncbi:caspase family protein [Alcanivorax sp. JB21]|uniref:caspase family protein n=1 Tax=Alcanivorax limicola TaxID=2874102 RepID=UPI001CBE272D|nr:caspase family protein [Alcanivorax limicola]MBZ2188244.1 caspase family protein [Alcanivorax limicola]